MRTLFCNAVFHSMVSEDDTFSCMTVRDGIIEETGHRIPEGRFDQVVDLQGQHAYPCLIDGHVHMLYTIAVMAMGFDLCAITPEGVRPDCMSGVEQKLREYCARQPKNAVVAAHNYIPSAVSERRMPTREELDLWCGGRPCVVYTIDGHSTALSSAMLRKIGIAPEGHTGLLTGIANEENQGKLTDVIASALTLPLLAKGIARFHNTCAEYGIGMVGALEGNADSKADLPTRLIFHLARKFELEVRFYLQYTDLRRVRPFAKYMRHKRLGGCGAWEMDGSVGSHSAALSAPYRDTGLSGSCYYTEEQAQDMVRAAAAEGYQVASHAIGDLAIGRIARAIRSAPGELLHRIEHLEFIRKDQLPLLSGRKIAAFLQPGYAWIDRRYLHTYESHLQPETAGGLLLRSIALAGVRVCLSTDSPVQSLNPYQQMLGAMDFSPEEESFSAYEALCAYTRSPAEAMGEEDRSGTLEAGKSADFFLSGTDLLKLTGTEIAGFRPSGTYYRGQHYRAKTGSVPEFLSILFRRSRKV